MDEDGTINGFHVKLLEISNEAYNLGEPIPERKLVEKVLRSVPDRLVPKTTAIEESHDVSVMKLEDLIGSLTVFESRRNKP